MADDRMRTFTAEELKEFDGRDGRPTYVAHQGKVYDLTGSIRWKNGLHMNRHHAGGDLTGDITAAPHPPDRLDRFPQVGVLAAAPVAEAGPNLPPFLDKLFSAVPFLRRHPHPMTVHFPIAFMIFGPVFVLLHLITGARTFETTSFHLLGAGALTAIVAMATGFVTWWVNYLARPMTLVIVKMVFSGLMLIVSIIAFIWRAVNPGVLDPGAVNVGYLVIVLSLFVMVSIVGWCGARLTFPLRKEGR